MKTVKIYELFNEHDQTYYDVYRAPGIDTMTVTIEVPRDVREPRQVRKHLLRGGADLPSFELCEHELVEAIGHGAEVVHRAGRTGWREDATRFVTHLNVVGDEGSSVLPPPLSILRAAGEIDVRGNLKGWKKLIAVAEYSTVMIVVCARRSRRLSCRSWNARASLWSWSAAAAAARPPLRSPSPR